MELSTSAAAFTNLAMEARPYLADDKTRDTNRRHLGWFGWIRDLASADSDLSINSPIVSATSHLVHHPLHLLIPRARTPSLPRRYSPTPILLLTTLAPAGLSLL